ncbi:MAG: DUF167 domain-containing protein [Acidimicrobiales bacterium]|jgi:uncharacterized protein YggU (UPF0235/DUF167 family)
MRLTVRVRPGASATAVGGSYGGGAVLVVRVAAPAVDGRATEAALVAIADAFGVPRRSVSLVHGATSHSKVVELSGDASRLSGRLLELLGDPPG